jgi:hypothetical protein
MLPCIIILTLVNLGMGVAGSFPDDNAASKWVIVVFAFFW